MYTLPLSACYDDGCLKAALLRKTPAACTMRTVARLSLCIRQGQCIAARSTAAWLGAVARPAMLSATDKALHTLKTQHICPEYRYNIFCGADAGGRAALPARLSDQGSTQRRRLDARHFVGQREGSRGGGRRLARRCARRTQGEAVQHARRVHRPAGGGVCCPGRTGRARGVIG